MSRFNVTTLWSAITELMLRQHSNIYGGVVLLSWCFSASLSRANVEMTLILLFLYLSSFGFSHMASRLHCRPCHRTYRCDCQASRMKALPRSYTSKVNTMARGHHVGLLDL